MSWVAERVEERPLEEVVHMPYYRKMLEMVAALMEGSIVPEMMREKDNPASSVTPRQIWCLGEWKDYFDDLLSDLQEPSGQHYHHDTAGARDETDGLPRPSSHPYPHPEPQHHTHTNDQIDTDTRSRHRSTDSHTQHHHRQDGVRPSDEVEDDRVRERRYSREDFIMARWQMMREREEGAGGVGAAAGAGVDSGRGGGREVYLGRDTDTTEYIEDEVDNNQQGDADNQVPACRR
ncbi:unnamed protein product [Vitrella brassicaformis CCMP3155]|uniref:Uncharacterized protein n=1 Tax=Vitrella brassicaformis (strain CCMP3155) TaxID=1169540 RepID=A0A0G4GIC5_VITBC|nr:unnamed protein product [Vitrella brassicaformis CCMP3155]|eukprot:CEM29582.1 unnamed protein product [Vitrella brassicaformis CCMP3155]